MCRNMDDKLFVYQEGEDSADWLPVDPFDMVALDHWLYDEEEDEE